MPSANSLLLFHPALCGMLRMRKLTTGRFFKNSYTESTKKAQRFTETLKIDNLTKELLYTGRFFKKPLCVSVNSP